MFSQKKKERTVHDFGTETVVSETKGRKQKNQSGENSYGLFNRPISISGINRIISQKDELLALSNADPEIETKRVKKMVSLDRAQFESDLKKLLEFSIQNRCPRNSIK